MKRIILFVLAALLAMTMFAGCGKSDADQAADNLGKAAEQFEVARRIVFINAITDQYLYELQGFCSLETGDSALAGALEITCRYGDDGNAKYKKFFFGKSDNTTWIVEQLEGISVSATYPRVIFKPESIVPDFDRP